MQLLYKIKMLTDAPEKNQRIKSHNLCELKDFSEEQQIV